MNQTSQNKSKRIKMNQNESKWVKTSQNESKRVKMGQKVSKTSQVVIAWSAAFAALYPCCKNMVKLDKMSQNIS